MKIEIKNYRSCRANEGDAYSCTLYLDGKRAALVKYDGWGGPIDFDFSVAAGKDNKMFSGPVHAAFKAYVEGLPEQECSWTDPDTGKPAMMQPNMEIVVDDAINAMLEQREFRKWCRKSVVFRVVGDKETEWRTLGVKWEGNQERVRAHLAKQYGDQLEEILNERFDKEAA